jgi:hypothetical protein
MLAPPPTVAWPELRGYVDEWLARTECSPLIRLLGTRPRSGFEVTAAEEPHRLVLAGRHRFSRYVLDLRMADAGDGTTTASAATYADFPGPHGSLYRVLVVRTRFHVLATRALLRGLRDRVARMNAVTGRWSNPTIRGERVTLRPIAVSDADAMWGLSTTRRATT